VRTSLSTSRFDWARPRLDPRKQRLGSLKLTDPFGVANNHRAMPPPAVPHCRAGRRGGPHPDEFLDPDVPQIKSSRCPPALALSPTALAVGDHRIWPAAAAARHAGASPIFQPWAASSCWLGQSGWPVKGGPKGTVPFIIFSFGFI
jgi:hypothetical protein